MHRHKKPPLRELSQFCPDYSIMLGTILRQEPSRRTARLPYFMDTDLRPLKQRRDLQGADMLEATQISLSITANTRQNAMTTQDEGSS